jgi:MFS family permease
MNNKKLLWILFVLAVTQVIGWGTISLPAVIGEQLSRDIGLGLPLIFAGSTTMLVVTGVAALLLSYAFVTYGARLVMAAGSVVSAFGFLLLAIAYGPTLYFLAWVVLGLSGAATLSTASYVFLNEMSGAAAKRPISALMLVTGLSSSIFWPITAALTATWGWRPTMIVYAALAVLVCFPLYIFGLPARHALIRDRATTATPGRRASAPVFAAGVGGHHQRVRQLGLFIDRNSVAAHDGHG